MIGVLQIKGRLAYGRVCQQTKDLGWDSPIIQPDLVRLMKDLLHDIVQVKEELVPYDRAWVKEGYELYIVVAPYDGSIEGLCGLQYCRSFNREINQYDFNLARSRSKCSGLDVGDNELSARFLNSRQAEVLVKSIPEKPKSLRVVLITDSQCTAHCHSDRFCHTVRRRRNVGVRFSRSLRRLHSDNDNVEILLIYARKGRFNNTIVTLLVILYFVCVREHSYIL